MIFQADAFAPESMLPAGAVAPGMHLERSLTSAAALLPAIEHILALAPLRTMHVPSGRPMSVRTSNCGAVGWVTDRHGYRYVDRDPLTGQPWPPVPAVVAELARDVAARAGYPEFEADACLVNEYVAGARMGEHQDRDEADFSQPIVSISLGLPATFFWRPAGTTRGRTHSVVLGDGDVLVFGGPARLCRHGVRPLRPGHHAVTGERRLNLTLRRALGRGSG